MDEGAGAPVRRNGTHGKREARRDGREGREGQAISRPNGTDPPRLRKEAASHVVRDLFPRGSYTREVTPTPTPTPRHTHTPSPIPTYRRGRTPARLQDLVDHVHRTSTVHHARHMSCMANEGRKKKGTNTPWIFVGGTEAIRTRRSCTHASGPW